MATIAEPERLSTDKHLFGRWWQLVLGIVCMSMIANLQYGWTLFVTPIDDKFGWGRAAIQVAFTIFVLTETWLVPIEGYLVDKYGPRVVILVSGALVGLSWTLNAFADSLTLLYVAAAIGGIGAGAVYGTCLGNALKWFPDRRGLASGLTAMGFGAGSALTIVPISALIQSRGYEATFLLFGLAQGLVILSLGWFMQAPRLVHGAAPAPIGKEILPTVKSRQYSPLEVLRTPVFWVMYAMFVLMATGGLMATAQLGPIARDFQIADTPVTLLSITLPALTFALAIDRVLNGVTRPFFGWVSDQIGREQTMFLAFSLEGFGIVLLSVYGDNPTAFVLLTGLVFFAWGEIYSLFPATCTDAYGRRYATSNYGLLYTAKGTAALLVPVTSLMAAAPGGWRNVFIAAAAMNFAAALLAMLILRPLRLKMQAAVRE
ncbi:MAG TPA: oxalate/formate MFS antiporter [Gammaproteobacteria bacterium]